MLKDVLSNVLKKVKQDKERIDVAFNDDDVKISTPNKNNNLIKKHKLEKPHRS